MNPKDGDGMANSADSDQIVPSFRSSLIWVYTVCPNVSVQKLRILMVVVKRNFFKDFSSFSYLWYYDLKFPGNLIFLLPISVQRAIFTFPVQILGKSLDLQHHP